MGYALQSSQAFDDITCGECGITFYVPSRWRMSRRNEGGTFHCPNGHPRVYRETENERLRKQLAVREQELHWEQERVKSLNKRLKTEITKHHRLKRRVAAGVCPCCHRTVRQLARHMKTQHPDFPDSPEATPHG
jgi:hypothetical protein